ncbi:MAG: hypothetical protein RMJ44_08460 [Cytophagales bacterium]|nr:hypothetical protein [Cytophagales bacterium]
MRHLPKNITNCTLLPAIFITLLLHSFCCVLPFLPLALGAGNVIVAWISFFTGYQEWIIFLQAILLLIAGYRAYRSSGTKTDQLVFWFSLVLTIAVNFYTWRQHNGRQKLQVPVASFGIKRFQNIKIK